MLVYRDKIINCRKKVYLILSEQVIDIFCSQMYASQRQEMCSMAIRYSLFVFPLDDEDHDGHDDDSNDEQHHEHYENWSNIQWRHSRVSHNVNAIKYWHENLKLSYLAEKNQSLILVVSEV